MRFALPFSALVAITSPAFAQDEPGEKAPRTPSCAGSRGEELARCQATQRARKSQIESGGITAKDGKLFNDTQAIATPQVQAKDYAGAAATYQSAIDANPKSAVLHRLYVAKAIALRQQGVVAYNTGEPNYPAAGATNEQIRAANAANAALASRKTAAAVPLFRQAQAAAGQAAALAAAPTNKDRGVDETIAIELRQDASLLWKLDQAAVLATPRASADLEAAALRKWLAANPQLAGQLVGQFGISTAATLAAKDAGQGLILADEVMARAGGDPEATLDYATLVAAKAPAGDPRRAKAAAALTQIEGSVTDTQRSAKLKTLKAQLAT